MTYNAELVNNVYSAEHLIMILRPDKWLYVSDLYTV